MAASKDSISNDLGGTIERQGGANGDKYENGSIAADGAFDLTWD